MAQDSVALSRQYQMAVNDSARVYILVEMSRLYSTSDLKQSIIQAENAMDLAIKSEKDFTSDLLALLDRMAELTLRPDDNFDEIRQLFETNELIRPRVDWRP